MSQQQQKQCCLPVSRRKRTLFPNHNTCSSRIFGSLSSLSSSLSSCYVILFLCFVVVTTSTTTTPPPTTMATARSTTTTNALPSTTSSSTSSSSISSSISFLGGPTTITFIQPNNIHDIRNENNIIPMTPVLNSYTFVLGRQRSRQYPRGINSIPSSIRILMTLRGGRDGGEDGEEIVETTTTTATTDILVDNNDDDDDENWRKTYIPPNNFDDNNNTADKSVEDKELLVRVCQRHVLFQHLSNDVITNQLVNAFERIEYTTTNIDIVSEQHHNNGDGNDGIDYMYIIGRGQCIVSIQGEPLPEPYDILRRGTIFGELFLLEEEKEKEKPKNHNAGNTNSDQHRRRRRATVTTKTDNVVVYRLDRRSFLYFVLQSDDNNTVKTDSNSSHKPIPDRLKDIRAEVLRTNYGYMAVDPRFL